MNPEYFGKWKEVIDFEELQRVINYLKAQKLFEAGKLCPLPQNIFRAFKYCDYDNLRVVILSQDPYPNLVKGKPVAQGIAFANSNKTFKEHYSSSLKVLIESVINFSIPHNPYTFDVTLKNWERQGVLLLNSALTCKAKVPKSHSLLWRSFTSYLLRHLSKYKIGIIYVLMGNEAQSFEKWIDSKSNFIFKVKHPSYYSRTGEKMPNSLWQNINKILTKQNGYGIEWYKEQRSE